MQTISERLGELIGKLGHNVNSFSKEIGYSNNNVTIGRIISDKEKMPSAETMQKISNRFTDVNLDWLLTGKGKMLKSHYQHNEVQNNSGVVGISGDGNSISNGVMELQQNYLEMLKKRDEQIDRLLAIIEHYEIWKQTKE
jgi:hypothetical protein